MYKHQSRSSFSLWSCVVILLMFVSISSMEAAYLPLYRSARGNPTRCSGFSCMFTGLSSKVANAAIMKHIRIRLRKCLENPNCIPNFSIDIS